MHSHALKLYKLGSSAIFTCNAIENGNNLMHSLLKTDECGIIAIKHFLCKQFSTTYPKFIKSDNGYYQCLVKISTLLIHDQSQHNYQVAIIIYYVELPKLV